MAIRIAAGDERRDVSSVEVGDRRGLAHAPSRASSGSASPAGGVRRAELPFGGDRLLVQGPEPVHPREDGLLAIVEAGIDVGREDERATRGADAIRDRDRVLALVADRYRDPLHAQLLGAREGAVVEAHRRLARGQAHDLDLAPADAADAEAEDLAHGLLGRPATGQVLGPVADVGVLGRGEDALREAAAMPGEGVADPVDVDDVDAQLGRARGWRRESGAARRVSHR